MFIKYERNLKYLYQRLFMMNCAMFESHVQCHWAEFATCKNLRNAANHLHYWHWIGLKFNVHVNYKIAYWKKKGCLRWLKLVVMLEQLSLLHCQCIQELLMFILKVTKKKEGYLIELLWHHSTVKVGPCSVMVWFRDAFSLEIISLTSYVIKKSKK